MIDYRKVDEEVRASISENLIENLPTLRKRAGVTQEELSRVLSVSRQTVLNVETKATKLTWTMTVTLLVLFL